MSVLEHLLSIIQSPPKQDTTYLSCSWAALVVLPHVRWENQLCLIVKSVVADWWKYLSLIFLLFHEKVVECQFECCPFSRRFLDRPLEKEKVIPLVTCFIESLFVSVDRGSCGKGQSQSPFVLSSVCPGTPRRTVNTWVPENSTAVVFWQNPVSVNGEERGWDTITRSPPRTVVARSGWSEHLPESTGKAAECSCCQRNGIQLRAPACVSFASSGPRPAPCTLVLQHLLLLSKTLSCAPPATLTHVSLLPGVLAASVVVHWTRT